MKISYNQSLKPYNTFAIDVSANVFVTVENENDLTAFLKSNYTNPLLILGGGSNLLFTKNFEGTVLKNEIKGVELVNQTNDHVVVKVGAGENWHKFVLHTLKQNWYGLENLSLIPGTVGAAPIQNIGAYGVEIKDFFSHLDCVAIADGEKKTFLHEECKFQYRNSIFKNIAKGKYIITHVYFKLLKAEKLSVEYGAIKETLKKNNITTLSAKAISDAVIEIRQSKLPDPKKIGNSGSFFKNPEIKTIDFINLKKQYPNLPGYKVSEEITKVPAGWLIEQAGWKGKRLDQIGVHDKQALVLVNYGKGNGNDIKNLALEIQTSVKEKFGIHIEPEVNIL